MIRATPMGPGFFIFFRDDIAAEPVRVPYGYDSDGKKGRKKSSGDEEEIAIMVALFFNEL